MEQIGYIGAEYVSNYIKPRSIDTHKGQCGRILIIAGSNGMAGAAVMCAKAALKSGSGLVTIGAPEELFNILQISVPEAMCVDRKQIIDDKWHNKLREFDAIAIGPGIGISEDNYQLIKYILEETENMIVIDADGINTLCKFDKSFHLTKKYGHRIVMTPHPGEANRILQCACKGNVNQLGRNVAVIELANFVGATVLLKGSGTLVADIEGAVSYNTTGNPGMATGGSGDVLTGVIASLCGIGYNGGVAARTGAYMHGLAGDLAAENIGQWGMTAMNIIDLLPEAFRMIVGK